MKCIYCGEKTENIINDECVCLNCMNRLYAPCENCGELHDKEKMTETDIGYICSECLESDFTRCFECGDLIHNDNIRTARSDRYGREVYVCEYCCNRSYTLCEECGEYVENEEGTERTSDGQWRCYECLDKRKELMRGICGVMVKSKRRRLRKIYISLLHIQQSRMPCGIWNKKNMNLDMKKVITLR